MDALRELVHHYSGLSTGIAVAAILAAALILKQLKTLALFLVVLASFIIFILMYGVPR
jgi:hypothetical protein